MRCWNIRNLTFNYSVSVRESHVTCVYLTVALRAGRIVRALGSIYSSMIFYRPIPGNHEWSSIQVVVSLLDVAWVLTNSRGVWKKSKRTNLSYRPILTSRFIFYFCGLNQIHPVYIFSFHIITSFSIIFLSQISFSNPHFLYPCIVTSVVNAECNPVQFWRYRYY